MAKANRTFIEADAAVSPVIGVILMVAITVVLAAVVFVLVTNLTKNPNDSPPKVAMTRGGSGNSTTLTLVGIDSNFIPWSSFSATTTPSTCVATLPSSGNLTAGQVIQFSGTGCNGATFSLVYAAANTIAYTTVLA